MGAFWDAWNKQGAANTADSMAGLQQMQGLQGILAQGQKMQQAQRLQGILADPNLTPEQKRAGAISMMTDPGQVANMFHQQATEKATNDLRTAQMTTQQRMLEEAQRKAAAEQRVAGAQESLQGLLSPDVSARDGMQRTPFVGSEADLVKHMQTNPGVYSRVDPMQVRGLQAVIDPRETMKGILSPPKTEQKGRVVTPGAAYVDDNGNVKYQAPFAPRVERPEKVTPYSDIGRIRQDLANKIISPEDAAVALKALTAKKELSLGLTQLGEMHKFRSEYTGNPEVKKANMLQSSVVPIAEYITNYSKTGEIPTQDLAVVKTFLAMTHPKGDAISNLDRKEIGTLGNFPERFKNAIQSWASGKQLPDPVRNDMWKVISDRYKEVSKQREGVKQGIVTRARRAKIPVGLIFEDMGDMTDGDD